MEQCEPLDKAPIYNVGLHLCFLLSIIFDASGIYGS